MPAWLARIVAVAESFGITIDRPSRGSRWKAKKPGYRTYPIPAHNGSRSEISDVYIAGSCRAFEIDLAEFKSRLRSPRVLQSALRLPCNRSRSVVRS